MISYDEVIAFVVLSLRYKGKVRGLGGGKFGNGKPMKTAIQIIFVLLFVSRRQKRKTWLLMVILNNALNARKTPTGWNFAQVGTSQIIQPLIF